MGKFTPVSENDYAEHQKEQKLRFVWPIGWYSAMISDAPDGCTEGLGSSGNMYFKTIFIVYNDEGKEKKVFNYVMAEGKAAFQLRSLAEAVGALDEYKAGILDEDTLKGKTCFVKLGLEKDENGKYDPKNIITQFATTLPGKEKSLAPGKKMTKKENEADLGDSIPF